MTKTFLSYSHADKEFVYLMNATLLANGIETFLDEKDIQVGDSIPSKIYEGIEKSTHLIFTISAKSIESQWVTEELSVAKVKEKENAGFRILPVLIDDVVLPISVRHILYADMRQWKDPIYFRRGFLKILIALDHSFHSSGIKELQWYANNFLQLRDMKQSLLTIEGEIAGGLQAGLESHPANDAVVHGLLPTKWAFTESGVHRILQKLLTSIPKNLIQNENTKLIALTDAISEALKYQENEYIQITHNVKKAEAFRFLLKNINNLMEEIFIDIDNILLASVRAE